jgi:hypothetical protein
MLSIESPISCDDGVTYSAFICLPAYVRDPNETVVSDMCVTADPPDAWDLYNAIMDVFCVIAMLRVADVDPVSCQRSKTMFW